MLAAALWLFKSASVMRGAIAIWTDVEFFFAPGDTYRVQYRTAARVGERGGETQRKRVKALRLALTQKGWKSVGFGEVL